MKEPPENPKIGYIERDIDVIEWIERRRKTLNNGWQTIDIDYGTTPPTLFTHKKDENNQEIRVNFGTADCDSHIMNSKNTLFSLGTWKLNETEFYRLLCDRRGRWWAYRQTELCRVYVGDLAKLGYLDAYHIFVLFKKLEKPLSIKIGRLVI